MTKPQMTFGKEIQFKDVSDGELFFGEISRDTYPKKYYALLLKLSAKKVMMVADDETGDFALAGSVASVGSEDSKCFVGSEDSKCFTVPRGMKRLFIEGVACT